jgi:Hemerythrin HHE cation binding domain
MPGLIYQMLAEDHRRLEDLLALAEADPGARGGGAYEEFRSGLLRHMGMEENILIPSAHRARGGERLPMADRIRLDHGALAALLAPPPTPEIIACIKAILSGHNLLEEGKDGLYKTCEQLAGSVIILVVDLSGLNFVLQSRRLMQSKIYSMSLEFPEWTPVSIRHGQARKP